MRQVRPNTVIVVGGPEPTYSPEAFSQAHYIVYGALEMCIRDSTGTLPTLKRQEAEALVKERGGKILSGVSKNLQFLVVGDNPGTKLNKAQKLNVPIMSEAEFLDYIKER